MFIQKKSIADRLSKLLRARAGYDSGRSNSSERCFEGTRTAILKNVTDGLDRSPVEPIYWVNGLAGIGKSTVARKVAENEGVWVRLSSSPEARSALVRALEDDPDTGTKSFAIQLHPLRNIFPKVSPSGSRYD